MTVEDAAEDEKKRLDPSQDGLQVDKPTLRARIGAFFAHIHSHLQTPKTKTSS